MKKFTMILVFLLAFTIPAKALEEVDIEEADDYILDEDDIIYSPLDLSLFPPISLNSLTNRRVVNSFSFNIIAGQAYGLYGVEIGFINLKSNFVQGIQFSNFGNWVGGDVKGAQFASFANFVGHNINGAQFGSFMNITGGNVIGAQFSGFGNISGKNLKGAQFSGFGNITGKNLRGAQFSGFGNIVVKDLKGAQFSGFSNITGGNILGAQFSVLNIAGDITGAQFGLVNIGKNIKGLQFGAFNYSESIEGAPVGLISIVRNGKIGFSTIINENGLTSLNLQTGNKNVYSIISLGLNPVSNPFKFTYGFGLGAHIPINERFYSNIEVSSTQINNNFLGFNNMNLQTFRLTGGVRVSEKFSFIGGASLNILSGNNLKNSNLTKFSFLNTDNVVIWPGIFAGFEI